MKLLVILLFPLLAFSQTVQINKGVQTSSGLAPLTTGLTSINGDTTAAQQIVGAGGITVGTTGGVTTITGSGGGGGMVYPSAGIGSSTGSAWGTSYSATHLIPANFLGSGGSGTGTNCLKDNQTFAPCGGASNLLATSYSAAQNGWPGSQLAPISNPANVIRAAHFYYGAAYPVTFNTINMAGQGTDAVNGSAVAIWDVTVATNHLLCHSATQTLGATTAFFFPCVEGSVQLTPGHDYVFLSASGGTAATVYSQTNLSPVLTKFYTADATATGCSFNNTVGSAGINCSGNFSLNAQYALNPTAAGNPIPSFLLSGPATPSGAPTTPVATSYSSLMHGIAPGVSNVPLNPGGVASRINGRHFHYGVATDLTFSSIYLSIVTGDTGTYSAVAIWDVTDQTAPYSGQHMVCHSLSVAATAGAMQFPCNEGSATLLAGHDYVLLSSSTSVGTTTAWGMSPQFAITRYGNFNLTNCLLDPTNGISCSSGWALNANYGTTLVVSALSFWLQ